MIRPGLLLTGVLVTAAALVGCSSDSATDTVTTVATTAPPTTIAETTTTAASTTSTQPAATGTTVVSFPDAASIEGWSNVDDSVMGGVSASTATWDSGRMVFAGDLSLENNGGFTSVRSPSDPALGERIGDASSLAIDAIGDGRTYVLQLRTTDESLYIARFTTVADVEQQYVIPLTSFEPVTRFLDPSPDSPPLVATNVQQLALYLLDKQEGTFRLAMASITAQP